MKLVIDERVKHRLIGLLVILSLGAIFTPAIIKKSNQRFDSNMNLSVELPEKPILPKVAVTEKKIMFEEVQVAKLELPNEVNEKVELNIAKAKPLSEATEVALQSEIVTMPKVQMQETIEPVKETMPANIALVNPKSEVKQDEVNPAALAALNKPVKINATKTNKAPKKVMVTTKAPVVKKPIKVAVAVNKNAYAVQLATFAKETNAHTLVSKLRSKGYKAKYSKVATGQGALYKVIVGSLNRREEAQLLQKKLASAVQINGFIITTGQG